MTDDHLAVPYSHLQQHPAQPATAALRGVGRKAFPPDSPPNTSRTHRSGIHCGSPNSPGPRNRTRRAAAHSLYQARAGLSSGFSFRLMSNMPLCAALLPCVGASLHSGPGPCQTCRHVHLPSDSRVGLSPGLHQSMCSSQPDTSVSDTPAQQGPVSDTFAARASVLDTSTLLDQSTLCPTTIAGRQKPWTLPERTMPRTMMSCSTQSAAKKCVPSPRPTTQNLWTVEVSETRS